MKRTATLLAITGLALSANIDQNIQDDEQFIPLLVRAGVWALGHPQQITKGVEVGVKAIPAVIGGTKKAIDWIQHHDDNDDEFFAQDDEFFADQDDEFFADQDDEFFADQDDEFFADQDDELFAPIVARAGVWALTHPQQITKGVEVGIKAAPAVIGGAKKAIDWIKHHDDDEFFAQEDDELFAPIVARAGVWALTHPQQITKGVEIGVKAAPAVIGGAKKAIDWIKHHDDDEFFAQEDDEYFAPIVARAGVWALTHPQQITKGVEVGIKAAPAVIGGAKKAIDWIKHHDDNDEFFAQDDELFVEKKAEVKPKMNGQRFRRGHVEVEKSNLEHLGDLMREGHKL